MYTIARAINGISLNGLEYLLDDKGEPQTFPSIELAVQFLHATDFGHLTEAEILEAFVIENVPNEINKNETN